MEVIMSIYSLLPQFCNIRFNYSSRGMRCKTIMMKHEEIYFQKYKEISVLIHEKTDLERNGKPLIDHFKSCATVSSSSRDTFQLLELVRVELNANNYQENYQPIISKLPEYL